MQTRIKLALAALTAALALGAILGSASASKIALSERAWRATFSRFVFSAISKEVACPVTLEGSFHEKTITKTFGSQIGYITRTNTNLFNCTGGDFILLEETLPWNITYDSFTGTLPQIGFVIMRFVNFAVRVSEFAGLLCLYRTSAGEPIKARLGRLSTGTANVGFLTEGRIRPVTFGCPEAAHVSSSSPITRAGETAVISITLVQ